MDKPLVSISCITYNHGNFIRECINGFLSQKTDFPFEILIYDDASTDETPEIIREYAGKFSIIKPILQKENQYSRGQRGINIKYNFPRAKGEYIALCEGDDYWTDQYKLQKQVDFLQLNPDYSLCFTRFKTKNERTGEFKLDENSKYFNGKKDAEFNFNNFNSWHIGTQTVVFRNIGIVKNSVLKYISPVDIHLYVELLNQGKGICLKDCCAVYRNTGLGVYTSGNYSDHIKRGVAIYADIYQKNKNNKYLKLKYQLILKKELKSVLKRNEYFLFAKIVLNSFKKTLSVKFLVVYLLLFIRHLLREEKLMKM